MNLKAVEVFLNTLDSRYRGVLVVAKRAKQLQKGLRTLFEGKAVKVTTLALDDFTSGRVVIDLSAEPEPESVTEIDEDVAPIAFPRIAADFPEIMTVIPEDLDSETSDEDNESEES